MSLPMESRKNRSSSTTETNSFFITPPLAVRSNPPCGRPNNAVAPAWDDVICAKNAAGAMPVPPKLWRISGRELRRLGAKGGRRAVSVRVNFVLRPCVSSEEEWGCSRNSVRVTHPPVFRQRFKGLNASASTPAMRVELISQDRAQSRMHVGAGFEQGDVRAGSEQTTLYEIIG